MDVNGIPPKPTLPLNGKPDEKGNPTATPEDRLKFQEESQAYWFAINSVQNQQNQEALTRSNMQKAEHDALMEVARNLK